MIISDLHGPPAGTSLLDCDVRDGQYAVLVDRGDSQLVQFNEWTCSLPPHRYCSDIRLVNTTTVVALNNATRGEPNALLIKHSVGIVGEFTAGDNIMDVVVVGDLIAVTYGDEGIFGKVEPSPEGIAIFSLNGDFLWGYHTALGGPERGQIWDCYCACEGPDGRLWFKSYGTLPLVGLDCRTRTQKLVDTPKAVSNARALSTDGSSFWFFSPSIDASSPRDQYGFIDYSLIKWSLIKWTAGSRNADHVGEFEGRPRGLPGGSFIMVSRSGYRLLQVAA